MATEAAIERWDNVLYEVEKIHLHGWLAREAMTPEVRRHQYARDLVMLMETIFMPFHNAWSTDRPAEGSDLYEVLKPVAETVSKPLDVTQAAVPQIDPKMALIGEARRQLGELGGPTDVDEVIGEIERLLKVTVLVARVSHQGASNIVDTELQARFEAVNKNGARAPKYLDLHTMLPVDSPSKTAISMAVILSMVDPGVATWEERLRVTPNEENQPPIMKQFAAQWVVSLNTEWSEHYRAALAAALGCDADDINSEYFADINRMRQDYVHNRGICRNSARNKVLKWYRKGDKMIPKHADYLQLLEAFPADELRSPTRSVAPPQRQQPSAKVPPDLIRKFETMADQLQLSKDAALEQALTAWVAANQQQG